MSGDVVYSDVKFAKKASKNHKLSTSEDEDITYSQVKKKKSSTEDADAIYSQVRKNKSTGARSPQDDDVTYCKVNVAPAPQEAGPQPKKVSPETSNGKKLRVIVGIVLVLLVLTVIAGAISVWLYMRAQTDALTGATVSTPMTTTTHGTATTASPSTAPCKLVCDTDWELQEKRCFHFSTNKLTWEQSREDCKSKSGRLVKIFGKKKQKFLFGKVRSLMEDGEDKFWIGLTDSAEEGQWRWTDGSLLNSR
uniref:C-type lectin domain-containing protein n=1 Tax=Knipowitschia caucasica TaxID=637954 RepID=A0AAV2K6H2_KNICA